MQPTQSQTLRWSPAFSVDAQAMSGPFRNWAAGGAPSRLIGIRLCGSGRSTWTAPTRGGEVPGRACAASDAGGGNGGSGAGVSGAEYGSGPSDSFSEIIGSSAIHASSLTRGRARVVRDSERPWESEAVRVASLWRPLGVGGGAGDDTSRGMFRRQAAC